MLKDFRTKLESLWEQIDLEYVNIIEENYKAVSHIINKMSEFRMYKTGSLDYIMLEFLIES